MVLARSTEALLIPDPNISMLRLHKPAGIQVSLSLSAPLHKHARIAFVTRLFCSLRQHQTSPQANNPVYDPCALENRPHGSLKTEQNTSYAPSYVVFSTLEVVQKWIKCFILLPCFFVIFDLYRSQLTIHIVDDSLLPLHYKG
uniref:Uncharacterized protein n=1 Tax=Steinernema glaseri TaxID=37863 RepID=A0A1I8AJE0_9BILA